MKSLIIVESRHKAEEIQAMLGSDYIVIATFGHIRDLPEKEMGLSPPNFVPQYEFTAKAKKRKILSQLREAKKNSDVVLLATDPDREGEAIAWHLAEVLGLRDPQRVTYQEIRADAIKEALASPRPLDIQLVQAQAARRAIDRLTGFLTSKALSRTGRGLTAGRVQSIANRMVVDREREILNFVSVTHYGARLNFGDKTNGDAWAAEWKFTTTHPDAGKHFLDPNYPGRVASEIRRVKVADLNTRRLNRKPPPPFKSSTLQQAGAIALGFTPDRTMALAQWLYEHGYITYHRTDLQNIGKQSINEVREWLYDNNMGHLVPPSPNTWTSKKDKRAQEAHEACRVTDVNRRDWSYTGEKDDADLMALYTLIWHRTIACQMAPAVYDTTDVRLTSIDTIDGQSLEFTTSGSILVSAGWMTLTKKDAAAEGHEQARDNDTQILPGLHVGQELTAVNGTLLTKKTQPPKRYNEASLIKELEDEGIGRPSTFATVSSTLKRKGYVSVSGKDFVPTEIGNYVRDALVGQFSFSEIDYTRHMEDELDQIASGTSDYLTLVKRTYAVLDREIGSLSLHTPPPGTKTPVVTDHKCPRCGSPLAIRTGRRGKFFGCTTYPNCDYTAGEKDGKPVEHKIPEKTDHKCPSCGSPMVLRQSRSGSDFFGCSAYPKCKQTQPSVNGVPGDSSSRQQENVLHVGDKCPDCKLGKLQKRAIKNGDNTGREYLGCSKYPSCRFFRWTRARAT